MILTTTILEGQAEQEGETPAFPIGSLPPRARAIAQEAAGVYGLPVELPASMALAIVSASLGQGIVLSNPPHETAGNLFVLAMAKSGSGKSNAFRLISKPIYEYESDLVDRHASACRTLDAEREILEGEIAKARRQDAGQGGERTEAIEALAFKKQRLAELERKAMPPELVLEDSTSQKMALSMECNKETMALLSPESGDVVSNLAGRYNATNRADDTLFLNTYSREHCKVSRIGRAPVHLSRPCMIILLCMTPDICEELFASERFSEGGLMPRFLVCTPQTRWQRDDGEERSPNEEAVNDWEDLVWELASAFRMRESEAATVRLSGEANELLRSFWNGYVERQDEFDGVASFAARHREQAAKLSLVLHAMRHGKRAEDSELSSETMQNALQLMEYFAAEQSKLLAGRVEAARERKLEKLIGCIVERYDGSATLRDLQKSHGFDPEIVEQIANENPDRLSIETIQPPTGGRPSRVVRVMEKAR